MLNVTSARLKIERAKKHIRDLDAEKGAFLGGDPYRGVPRFNPEMDRTEYILQNIPVIPDNIPLILGDAVHNLRSALDHLACELVRSENVEPRGVYFPIFESAAEYESKSAGKTKGMPESAKKIIARMKPYLGGHDILWGLHKLDIIDKHRLLPTVGMTLGGWRLRFSLTAPNVNLPLPSILEKGVIIASVPGNRETEERVSIFADIVFGEPEVFKGEPIIETLTQLAGLIETTVSYFEDFCVV
jgi:hypothetical protein